MSSFEEMAIDPLLKQGVKRMGFGQPFPIQAKTIGALLQGRDVIGQAKTGSGKTAAFAIPILQFVDPRLRRVQALVLAPTRELAVQIAEETKKLGAYTGVKTVAIYGGQAATIQHEALRHGVQVVIGTPGRILDLMDRGWLDLSDARFVVLDEADTMLDMGFIDDVEMILKATPAKRQTALFSATIPGRIADLSARYMVDPLKAMVDEGEPMVDTLDQFYAVVDRGAKLEFLSAFLQREKPPSAIVFCRTKWGADRLARDLQHRGFGAVPLHGDLSQHQRDNHMGAFRSGHADLLVATDVASRGIDVSQVACVINFDVPADPLLYFHRVGRTARAGRSGRAFSFVSRDEFGDFAKILRMSKTPIAPMREEDRKVRITGREKEGDTRQRRRFRGGRRRWSRGRRRS
jgi:ATP-dependent RNA helicase DeaD